MDARRARRSRGPSGVPTQSRRRGLGVIGSLAVVAVIGAAASGLTARAAGAATSTKLEPGTVERVLIVSLPGIGWSSIDAQTAPNLWRLFETSAVGNLTARTQGRGTLAAGYLTLGAGTRALAPQSPVDGAGMEPQERFGSVTARDAFRRNTGRDVGTGVLQLGLEPIVAANEDQRVDAVVGALGDRLRSAGFSRAVIANGDGHLPDQPEDLRRDAVNALMGADGVVPGGRVGTELLAPHEGAPFGVRYDDVLVLDAFRDAWKPRSVVLVEGSDLVRADAFFPTATPEQAEVELARALRRTDALVGGLLAEVDPERDAVVVTSPTRARDGVLTAVAVQAPGVPAGLLSSASTRRSGFVLLGDVAPTVVSLLGLPRDRDMRGSPFRVGTARPLTARVDALTTEKDAAVFRDEVRTAATYVFAVVLAVVLAGAAVVVALGGGPRARWWLGTAALALVAYLATPFLARALPFHERSHLEYWAFLAVVPLAVAALARIAGRRRDDAITLVLGFVVVLLVVDVLTGARLQLGSSFGYSAAVGIRVAGLGNVAYAIVGSCTVLLAGLLVHRLPGRIGVTAAILTMTVVLIVDAAPSWGSDVGGALSLVPAFGVAALGLLGVRVRLTWRSTAVAVGASVAVLVALAAVDLSRPADARTHLGRLAQQIADRGVAPFADTVARKIDANLDTWTTTEWRAALVVSALFGAYALWRERAQVQQTFSAVPEMRPAFAGLGVLAVVGYVVNDSGVVVPAVATSVGALVLVLLLLAHGEPPDRAPTR